MTAGSGGLPAVPLEPLSSADPMQVGSFRLLGRLGAGGMGVAYLASSDDGRWVVVKTVWPHLAVDRSFRARLTRELAVMQSMRGTSTVALVDADADAEVPWFAMEFIPGMTLTRRVEELGPLVGVELTEFASGLLTAIDEIHQSGVTHRDIKPSNVMLSPDGPRLIDFGIADLAEGTQLTKTGSVLGSTGWLAPEQVRGDTSTQATDVHAWALCVIYAATGVPPFGADTSAAAMYRVLESTPDVPATLPESLRNQLVAALAKDPTVRPNIARLKLGVSPSETRRAGTMPSTQPQPPATPPREPAKAPTAAGTRGGTSRAKVWAAIGAVVVLVVVTGGALIATQSSDQLADIEQRVPTQDGSVAQSNDGAGFGAPPPASNSGACTIGTLLPESGNLSFLGAPALAGARLALSDVTAANGPIGAMVERDSGDTSSDRGERNTEQLVAQGVSAIVGPMSSGVARTVVDRATAAGVVMISPSATAPWLSEYPDDGLFFRTVPSDSLQGSALASTLLANGLDSVAILQMDPAAVPDFSEPIADFLQAQMELGGGVVTDRIVYDPSARTFEGEVARARASGSKAIVVIGFEESTEIVRELIRQGIGPQDVPLFLTDGNISQLAYRALPKDVMVGTRGTLPGVPAFDDFQTRLNKSFPALSEYYYAAETYDAVMLLALGMLASGSCSGKAIAAGMIDVSSGGQPCSDYVQCATLLNEGQGIDYQGVSGPIEFLDNGDIGVGQMPVYEFSDNETFALSDVITVEAPTR